MKKIIIILFILPFLNLFAQDKVPLSDAELAQNEALMRSLAKDIFDLNGVPFVQPMVEAVNSISNDGFYNTAYIDNKKDAFSIKFSVHTMYGSVPSSKQWYRPQLPNEQFADSSLFQFSRFDFDFQTQTGSFDITDTAGLYYYLFKTLLNDGIVSGEILPPEKSATLLGSSKSTFNFRDGLLGELARRRIDSINQLGTPFGFQPISDSLANQIASTLNGLPSTIALPEGGSINQIFAAVPQIDIGLPYGFELNLRYIPEINYGKNIGDFGFWGFGLRHNISQWWNEENSQEKFQVALQFAMQGTNLSNVMEITSTRFEASAIMTNFNLHFSQRINNLFDVFGGLSYESINIINNYTYFLSHQIQVELYGNIPEDGYMKTSKAFTQEEIDRKANKDDKPQTAEITLTAEQIKYTLGLYKQFGDFDFYAAYSISQFNILNFGLSYKFDLK